MKVGPLDKNGLDLLFTFKKDVKKDGLDKQNVKSSNIQSTFRAAMEKALAPDKERVFQTPMASCLDHMLEKYFRDMSKKLTIIVLTTGEWEDASEVVEKIIAKHFTAMRQRRHDFERERLCTIQFVAFGEKDSALARLCDLDEKMSTKYGIP